MLFTVFRMLCLYTGSESNHCDNTLNVTGLLEKISVKSHQHPETAKHDEPGVQHDTEQHLDTGTETLLSATIFNFSHQFFCHGHACACVQSPLILVSHLVKLTKALDLKHSVYCSMLCMSLMNINACM